jgi:hypothetical protein
VTTISAGFSRVPARAARAKLSATDWQVLHVIGLHADHDGRAFPSMLRIAEIAGIDRSNVPRSIARIESHGLLVRNRMPKPTGGWQVNQYQLVYEPIGDVINGDDKAVVSSAHMTADVISIDDTPDPVSSTSMTGCHQRREQGVICADALTTQGTEDSYQERKMTVETLSEAGVPREVDVQSPDRSAAPPPDEAPPVPADDGGLPPGKPDRPADEAEAPAAEAPADRPASGKPSGLWEMRI